MTVSSIDEEDLVDLLDSGLLNCEDIEGVIAVVRATELDMSDAAAMVSYPEYWIG